MEYNQPIILSILEEGNAFLSKIHEAQVLKTFDELNHMK